MIFKIIHYKELYETYEINAASKEEALKKYEETLDINPVDINVKDSEIVSIEEEK